MLPNGAIVNSEHGQLFDSNEINLIQRNEDHGYPYYDGNTCFIDPDTCASTTYTYTHPLWNFTHPPSGTEFYNDPLIPELEGKLITCILWHTGLMLFTFNTALDSITAEEYLSGGAFADMVRNRDIAIKPDGSFYLITNDRQDARIRWVHPDPSTGQVTNAVRNDAMRIWPNPTSDRITVAIANMVGAASLELLDARGCPVAVSIFRMGDRFLMEIENVPSGLYAVRVQHDGRCDVQHMVKE